MIGDPGFHRGSDAQGLMHAAEVIVHVVERDSPDVILDALGEGVRQSRKSAHLHAHGQVLSFYVAI
jgi:hypothetical protein